MNGETIAFVSLSIVVPHTDSVDPGAEGFHCEHTVSKASGGNLILMETTDQGVVLVLRSGDGSAEHLY